MSLRFGATARFFSVVSSAVKQPPHKQNAESCFVSSGAISADGGYPIPNKGWAASEIGCLIRFVRPELTKQTQLESITTFPVPLEKQQVGKLGKYQSYRV